MKKEIKKPYTKPTFEKRVNITQLTADEPTVANGIPAVIASA